VAPTGISIPAIGVESSDVAPMGLQKDGSPEVPPLSNVHQLGYYCPGRHAPLHCGAPLPGMVGSAVLVAHVNGDGKVGLFNNLWKLKPTDEIIVNLNSSRRAVFTVHRVITVAKTKFPYQDVWGVVDHPALRLVTCGPGPVDAHHSYLNNTVVFADLDQIKGS
jgi:sortase (surface protein transpeptidase)